jgi:hypothetical protein
VIDAPAVLHDYLMSQGPLTALIGTRLWAEVDSPPDEGQNRYKPADGPAIAFKSRGGQPDYTNAILHLSWQLKVYGLNTAANNNARRRTYLALMDALHDPLGRGGVQAQIEVAGQTLTEPRTGWDYTLIFVETWMHSGLPTFTPS